MNFKLTRSSQLPDGQFSVMLSEDGLTQFHCLERLDTLIPVGIYRCTRYNSPTKGEVFQINVPGRTYIEIHIANFQSQLEGCVAIGLDQSKSWDGRNMIINSEVAFKKFMSIQEGVDEFTLMVS